MACRHMDRELRLLMAGVNTATTRRGQKMLVRQQRCVKEAMHCKLNPGVNVLVDRIRSGQVCGVVMTTSDIKYTPQCGKGVNY
jgi:hypothetical protein